MYATTQSAPCGTETWHGTVGGYTNHKCRGASCAAAYRDYQRLQARRRQDMPTPDKAHGTVGGYTNWSCRCDACTLAMRNYRRSRA